MSGKIEVFHTDNVKMHEILRRFDEVLSDKASKSQLIEIGYEFQQSYVKKQYWEKLQSEIQQTMEKQQTTMKQMAESVKIFEVNMGEEVNDAVRRGLNKYMISYERVLSMFQKFFDHEELQKLFDKKADVTSVQSVKDIKANKIDVEGCLNLIESVHERMKHISILQVEMARSLIPQKTSSTYNADEALNHKISRRNFYLSSRKLHPNGLLMHL